MDASSSSQRKDSGNTVARLRRLLRGSRGWDRRDLARSTGRISDRCPHRQHGTLDPLLAVLFRDYAVNWDKRPGEITGEKAKPRIGYRIRFYRRRVDSFVPEEPCSLVFYSQRPSKTRFTRETEESTILGNFVIDFRHGGVNFIVIDSCNSICLAAVALFLGIIFLLPPIFSSSYQTSIQTQQN